MCSTHPLTMSWSMVSHDRWSSMASKNCLKSFRSSPYLPTVSGDMFFSCRMYSRNFSTIFHCVFSFQQRIYGNFSKLPNFFGVFLFLGSSKLLYVNGVFHLKSLKYRWFVELLTCAEFFYYTCLFKLSLELLEGLLNVFAFLYWYNNHFAFTFLIY